MALKINMDPSNLAKAIALARLPSEVLSAFQSPLDLQFQWAIPLTAILKEREEAVLALCAEFAAMDPKPKPKAIFDKIVTAGMSSQLQALTQPKILEGKAGRGEISLKGKKIVISLSGIDERRMADLEKAIQMFLQ
jgi:ParB family transcriptional regulator, chromosome partitioning protein